MSFGVSGRSLGASGRSLKASDKSLEASARSLGAQCSASKGRVDEVGATEILGVMHGSLGASGRLFRISAM